MDGIFRALQEAKSKNEKVQLEKGGNQEQTSFELSKHQRKSYKKMNMSCEGLAERTRYRSEPW